MYTLQVLPLTESCNHLNEGSVRRGCIQDGSQSSDLVSGGSGTLSAGLGLGAVPSAHPMEMLIRQLDTGAEEEDRGQTVDVGIIPISQCWGHEGG